MLFDLTCLARGNCLVGRRGCWLALALGLSGAAGAEPGLWFCPGNLFTNQLERSEAMAQSCVPALPSRVSQAHGVLQGGVVASPVAQPDAVQAQQTAATPPSVMAVNPAPASVPQVDPSLAQGGIARPLVKQQQQRDDDARHILQTELVRTQAQLQALGLRAGDPQNTAAVHRLRNDEAALQRELARLGR